MMRGRALIAIALTVILSACAFPCLAQKITVDPNTDAAPIERADVPDPRVAQKVTYECWHKPIKLILAELTKQTGVTLNAGYNKQDWQVRDRRMNVFVKDVTLAALMNSIARVMKFKWSISRSVRPPTYRLHANRKLIADLQSKAGRLQAAINEGTTRGRKHLLADFEKLVDLSPEELEKLKSENPYYYICADTGFAKLTTQMFKDIPELKDIFLGAEKNVCLPISTLSPATRQLYVDCASKNWRYVPTGEKLTDDYKEQLARRDIVIIGASTLPDSPGRLKDYGAILTQLENGTRMTAGWLDNPDSRSNQAGYRYCVRAAELDGDWAKSQDENQTEMDAARKETGQWQEGYRVLDPPAQHPDEPDLHKKVDLQAQWKKLAPKPEQVKEWGDDADRMRLQLVEKAISLASGLGVVSDSFATVDRRAVFDYESKDKELLAVLDSFGECCFTGWEKHGPIVEFRCRDWFHRRAWQIPDGWVERWRSILERTGTLPLDDYAQMATLDLAQIWENLYHEPMLARAMGSLLGVTENQGVLRFYLRLNPDQKKMLFADGLDIGWLRPDQRQSYSDMFNYGTRFSLGMMKFSNPGDKRVTIKAKVDTDADKLRKWFFTVYVDDEDGATIDTTFRIPIPNVPVKPATPAKPG